jgi:N-methylhydantoinase B
MPTNWIYELANLLLLQESSGALITWDGDVLHAKSKLAFETTGFKSMVDSSLKYIQLKPGDVLLANDPYSGGSFLYRYSFLLALSAPDGNSPGLVLCVRRAFGPRLSLAAKLDEEGLRIPPTPIVQQGQVVVPLLEAMAQHPLSPENFSPWLQEITTELKEYYRKWVSLEKNFKQALSTAEVKKFLQFSHRQTSEKIHEKAQGDARTELRLDSGEILKLHLEIQDGRIKADFGGSTAGVKTFLPDDATFGSCYAAVSDFYSLSTFRNSGTFSALQVIKPSGCFLNAKFPASTYRGFQIGTAAVFQVMTSALHQIVKTTQTLWNEDTIKMELAFSKELRWLSEWSAKKISESLSVETLEARYPIHFERIEKTVENAGLTIEFKTLGPCQWQWLSDFTQHPLRTPKGLKAPPVHKIEISGGSGEWKPLASSGSTDLIPGTKVRLSLWGAFESTKKP